MEELMDRCMEMMNGGMMGMDGGGWMSGLLLVGLLLLLFLVLGVAALGTLGIWAFRRFRHGSARAH